MEHRWAGTMSAHRMCTGLNKEPFSSFPTGFLVDHIHTLLQMHTLVSLMLKSSNKALNNFLTNIEQLNLLF